MQSALGFKHQSSQNSGPSAPCVLWPVDLKLTHLDWNPEVTLIHFQGQYLTICELDYSILQGEIQNIPKTKAAVDVGEFCLVEDLTSARWYRGRVQNRKEDLFDVFLIDHGNVLSVDVDHISSCSSDLFILPPKIVCGFLANVLLLQGCCHSVVEKYFADLIGRNVSGFIQAFLPHKVLLLEAPDINSDLVRHGFGRHVDTDSFLLLVELITEVPLKQNIDPVPDLLIKKPRGQEFSFKPSGLQGYKEILSFCGPRLSCGTRAKVRVTAAVNPGLFYCQMASMESDLCEISKRLAAVCEDQSKEHKQKTPENLGLMCLVKGKDGKWARGFVQFLPVNSQVRVLFVDYGFFESVQVENVHRLPPDFYSTPIMAFPCLLSSLSDQDEAVTTQQLSFLKEGLLGRVLDVEIRGFDEAQYLYSITVIGTEDNHVKEPEPIQELPEMKVEAVVNTEELSPQGGYLYHETPMGKALEAQEVQVDSVFVGYVEYVQNPSHFWIRTQKHNDEFEEMMTKMTDHFSQVKLEEDVLLNPEPGTLCCAVYEEDMHFYRGVVTDTLEHGAEVLFIDFGNIEKVPSMLIKKIPEMFARRSAFAFCCTLNNVLPLDEVWTSATSDFFKRSVSDKALLVHVAQMRQNKFVVDLYEMGSDNSRSITELLISSKQAENWNNIPIKPLSHKVENHTDVTEKTRWPNYSVTSTTNGNTEHLEDCKEKTWTADIKKTQSAASFKALSIKPGCDFAVCCSYINSPSDFWCQPLDKVPDLKKLMDKIQKCYSTHIAALQSGDSVCVAKSPQDGRWYRAFITEKQKDQAIVMFVDYGCTFQIKEHSLQAIMPQHVYLEAQAFRCSLYNLIEPAGPKNTGDWSPEACTQLKDFVFDSSGGLRCKVVSQLNVKNKVLCNVVDLYNAQTQQSITNVLLEQGLARELTISTQQASVFPESFVYSSYDLRPGNEEQAYITHVSSQWEVYCHLERNTELIEELEKKISEESQKMIQASTRAVVRKLCLAKYFDGKWYRGLAHPVQSPLHLSVFFVDYGNANISEKAQVMFIPRNSAHLLYTPMQAIRCNLASVSKEELYADVKEWLDGAILNKQMRLIIVGKSEDGSFDVELFDGDININEKVKELILSLSPKPNTAGSFDISSSKTKHQTPHTRNTKVSVKCKSQTKGQSSNSPAPNVPRGTQVGSASQKKKANTNSCVHGKAQNKNIRVKLQNEDIPKHGVLVKPQKTTEVKQQMEYHDTNTKSEQPQHTEEKGNSQLSCLPDMKVSPGFRAKCFVSHIDSINSFFLQLSEDEPAILEMAEELNLSNFRDTLKTTSSLRVNDLALAEYEEDGALYRATVKVFKGSSCFEVEFVDYGNSAVIGKEKIYSIPKKYLLQPRFSTSCSLMDTSTYKNDASFTDAVMEKPLMVDFVCQYGNQWKVKVEIVDEAEVGLPVTCEATVESSTETEKDEEAPVNSSETDERLRSCEQKNPSKQVSENETAKSKIIMPTFGGENVMPRPPSATLSPKLNVVICRHHRTPTRKNRLSKKIQRKTTKSSVKLKSGLSDAITPVTIRAKDRETGTILSVLSNSYFYVRLNKTSELLAALESHIAENLYKCNMLAEEDVKQGLKCLAQVCKDKRWRRAVVQHVGHGKCQVLLVDHGITEEIPSGSIRQQFSDLTKIPNLSVLCKADCLWFSEGEGPHELQGDTLKHMIGKEVKLVFECYSEADKLWKVEVVMNGLVVRRITPSLQQHEELIQCPAGNRKEKARGYSHLDTRPPHQLGFASTDIGKAYSGFAAAVTTPFEFCVALKDLLPVMNKVSIMLDDPPGQMTPLPEAHLVPGTCCLLKSESKNKWCRAEIVHADASVVLNLVDYGHYACLPYEDCSKLKWPPEEVTHLPKVTYPCILRGVKPVRVDGQWTGEAAIFFQQCLYQKNLQIIFRECVSNTHWKVDILADGIHVAKELVDAGHASYIDIMLGLRFQEQSLCNAAPRSPDDEEECGQKDEGSESTDEAQEKMPLHAVAGSNQCFLM